MVNRLCVWMAALALGTAIVFGDGIPGERLGKYYVNIGLVGSRAGIGLDDAFEVVPIPVRVEDIQTRDWVAAMPFYDGVTYRFRQTHSIWRLYKFEPGRRPVEIRLLALVFPPGLSARYHLQLRRTDALRYEELQLADRLQIIALMGLTAKGVHEAKDFIQVCTATGDTSNATPPTLLVRNAENMLIRYGLEVFDDGLPDPVVTERDRIATPGDPEDGQMKYMNAILSRLHDAEQALLDLGFNDAGETFFLAAADRAIPNNIGGYALRPEMRIRYVYYPRRAYALSSHGSPKACFVPVRITEQDREPYYPIYVFPAAMSSPAALVAAIRRELYHAQYWNALANLDLNDPGQQLLYEFLLRTAWPHLETDIFYAVNGGRNITTFNHDISAFNYEMRKIFLQSATTLSRQPAQIDTPPSLPWTSTLPIYVPPGIHHAADIYYNSAVQRAMQARPGDHGRLFDFAAVVGPPDGVALTDQKVIRQIRSDILHAIVSGYCREHTVRAQELADAINAVSDRITNLGIPVPAGGQADYSLIGAAGIRGFLFNDLDWLAEIGGRLGFPADEVERAYLDILVPGTYEGANRLHPEDADTMLAGNYHLRYNDIRNRMQLLCAPLGTIKANKDAILQDIPVAKPEIGAFIDDLDARRQLLDPALNTSLTVLLQARMTAVSTELGRENLAPTARMQAALAADKLLMAHLASMRNVRQQLIDSVNEALARNNKAVYPWTVPALVNHLNQISNALALQDIPVSDPPDWTHLTPWTDYVYLLLDRIAAANRPAGVLAGAAFWTHLEERALWPVIPPARTKLDTFP